MVIVFSLFFIIKKKDEHFQVSLVLTFRYLDDCRSHNSRFSRIFILKKTDFIHPAVLFSICSGGCMLTDCLQWGKCF